MQWLGKVEEKKAGKGVRKGTDVMQAIKATEAVQEGDEIRFDDDDEDDESGDEDGLLLPNPDAGGLSGKGSKKPAFDAEAAKKLEQSPALSGAIPMAIFDIAKKQPFFSPTAAETFFDLFAGFDKVSSRDRIVQHVLGAMEQQFPNHAITCSCQVRQPLVGVDVLTAAFPKALRESLTRLKGAMDKTEDKQALATKTTAWIDEVLATEGLDPGIQTVLSHTKASLESMA